MRVKSTLICIFLVIFTAAPSLAVPTHITVRVLSKGAKFVGTSMGGVLVTIGDLDTGEILEKGITSGTTGNTDLIMKTPKTRGAPISDEKSAKFTATLDIEEPRYIEVTAYGPLGQRQSANRVSATQWIVPGRHITGGDGWTLELPGFVVDVLSPPAHVTLEGVSQTVKIEANIVMMCGCPIVPGGLWDANKVEVKALLRRDGKSVGVLDMHYDGKPSQFAGTWSVNDPGTYEAIVYAYDPSNGNTGLDKVSFFVK